MPAAEGQAIAWLWIMKFIGRPPESSPSCRAPGSRLGQGWAGRADRQSSNAAQERARDREPAGPRERPAGDRSIAGEAAESGSLVDNSAPAPRYSFPLAAQRPIHHDDAVALVPGRPAGLDSTNAPPNRRLLGVFTMDVLLAPVAVRLGLGRR